MTTKIGHFYVELRSESAEYKSVCICHDRQHRTYLHGATPNLDASTNGPARFMDCNCPTPHTDEHMSRKPREKGTPFPKCTHIGAGNHLSDITVHLNQAAIKPTEKRGERED